MTIEYTSFNVIDLQLRLLNSGTSTLCVMTEAKRIRRRILRQDLVKVAQSVVERKRMAFNLKSFYDSLRFLDRRLDVDQTPFPATNALKVSYAGLRVAPSPCISPKSASINSYSMIDCKSYWSFAARYSAST
jgi:hypothetical protein